MAITAGNIRRFEAEAIWPIFDPYFFLGGLKIHESQLGEQQGVTGRVLTHMFEPGFLGVAELPTLYLPYYPDDFYLVIHGIIQYYT